MSFVVAAVIAGAAAAQERPPILFAGHESVTRFEGAPRALAFADLDGDALPDLVGYRADMGRLEIRFGLDGEPFADVPERAASSRLAPTLLVAGDYDGDDATDVAAVEMSGLAAAISGTVSTIQGSADSRAVAGNLDAVGRDELVLALDSRLADARSR